MKRKLISLFSVAGLFLAAEEPVFYRDFGAKGDGKTNDFAAIVKAHEFANKNNRPVKAEDNAVYFIGDTETTAIIQTDTDWGKAHFVIDDRLVTERFYQPLFRVTSRQNPFPVADVKPPKYGQKELGVKLPCKALVILQDENTRRYIRYGRNANKGSFQTDAVLVDENGMIDPETPFNWDFKTVSSAMAYPVDKTVLTIQGGTFKTFTNVREGEHRYFSRNININRSNTVVKGLRHEVVEPEGLDSWPYSGFITIGNCAYVTMQDCAMTGRKLYGWPKPGEKKRFKTGTYDISCEYSVKLYFNNVQQINDITDRTFWGIMGTNFCKAVHLENCRISRFDAHQGVTNASIRNCKLGHQGINAIGFGTFTVENTTVHAANFINFRYDYGSMWKGNFIVRNCTWFPMKKNGSVFYGISAPDHDFGYPCFMPEKITIDGLTVRLPASKLDCALFADFDPQKINDKAPYPYTVTKVLEVRGLKIEGGKITFSLNPELFKNIQVIGELPPECVRAK